MTLKRASRLRGVRAYKPVEPAAAESLRLDANEGPLAESAVIQALRALSAEDLRRYSAPGGLEADIGDWLGIDAERVVVTNGGDDAIDRVCRSTIDPGSAAVLHSPTFEMIGRSVRLCDGDVVDVPWFDGPFPTDAMISAIDERVRLVAMVSPNNPTGCVIPTKEMLRVIDAAGERGVLAMVDLAYVEFCRENPTALLLERPNVVLIRTFSKMFGLAGLRVGFAVGSGEVPGWLRAAGGPYPVSVASLAAAGAALRDADARVAAIRDRVMVERRALVSALRRRGESVLDGEGNFVLVATASAGSIAAGLAKAGVRVRLFSGIREADGAVRITLPGDEAEFDRLLRVIDQVWSVERSGS